MTASITWTESPHNAGVKFTTTIIGDVEADKLRNQINAWLLGIYRNWKTAEDAGAWSLLRFAEKRPQDSLMELSVFIVDVPVINEFKNAVWGVA